jgi:hypothetical protein
VFKETEPIINHPTKKKKITLQEKTNSIADDVQNAAKKMKQTAAGKNERMTAAATSRLGT